MAAGKDLDEAADDSASRGTSRLALAILFGTCLIAVGLAVGLALGLRSNDVDNNTTETPTEASSFGKYRSVAVASDAAECSKIGADIMILKDGSVVDAAIATLLCVGLANSHSMGIGGGFVMTIYNSSSKSAETLIAREKAPIAATVDMFAPENDVSSRKGGKAIGVPGEIAGYWEAYKKYGRLPWREIFEPSIKLAREGIPIGKALAKAVDNYKDDFDVYPTLEKWFYDDEAKRVKKEGDKYIRPKFADTLETVANETGLSFYQGRLADDVIADIKEAGGIISKEDLTRYTADWRNPVELQFSNGKRIYSVPPPASGVVFEYILNILDGYKFTKDDLATEENAVLTYHRIVEAMKFAYAKRSMLGDADFVDVQQLVHNMTSREFGERVRQQIDDKMTHGTMFYGPSYVNFETTGTSHLSVMDKDGNAVAVTSTINTYFGSKVFGSRTGIVFNNEMDDFSTVNLTNAFGVKPSPANFIKPGKRPLSSMCPSIIVDANGDVELVVGASGGTKITTASALNWRIVHGGNHEKIMELPAISSVSARHLTSLAYPGCDVTLYTLLFGMDVNEAIDNPRLHHQLIPENLKVEDGFSEAYIRGLIKKGHAIDKGLSASVVQAILRKDSEIQACSDRRKRGAPFGY